MEEIITWIKQRVIDFGDAPAWGALGISLLVLVLNRRWQRRNSGLAERSAIATEKSAEAAIRSANAAEKSAALSELQLAQAPDLAPKASGVIPDRDVQWRIEHRRNALYILRNVGTATATGVTADESKLGGLARQLPRDAAIRAGASVEFMLIDTWQQQAARELWLTWDGQKEPVAVPIPVAIQH